MQKAINTQYGAVDKIEIIDTEKPRIGKGEVLVKVEAAALNPKDILIRKGKFKRLTGKRFPQGIGFDFSGMIENANDSNLKNGTKVFGMLNGWQGRSCAAYVNVKVEELFLLPENISFEEGAGIPLAGQTALQAIRNIGKLKAGNRILINGASGGVGTLAIQIAKSLGGKVTTITSTKNREFCKSLGADQTISYELTNILESGNEFDVFFDVFGNHNFQKVASLLTPKGKYITTVPKVAILKEQFFNLFRSQKAKLVNVKSNKADLQWLHKKISQNEIRPVLDKVFNLEEIQIAQKYIESKRAKGKVVLQINRNV